MKSNLETVNSLNSKFEENIKEEFKLIQNRNISSISELKKAAYIISAHCALNNELNRYGAYMQVLEADNVSNFIKKKAKKLEVHFLSIAEQAVKDFNRGKFNPPFSKPNTVQGFQIK